MAFFNLLLVYPFLNQIDNDINKWNMSKLHLNLDVINLPASRISESYGIEVKIIQIRIAWV
jgi:hypothetical protein